MSLSVTTSSKNYADQPCERCGSKRRISKTWKEELKTSLGSSMIEVSQLTCTNKACQEEFDKNRAEELARIDERKSKKEEADKIRKDNIARTITARQKAKAALEAKTKKKK